MIRKIKKSTVLIIKIGLIPSEKWSASIMNSEEITSCFDRLMKSKCRLFLVSQIKEGAAHSKYPFFAIFFLSYFIRQVRDAWLRPADKRPDGRRDILGNFHDLKDGDEVVSYWPFESNSDESDMYFDGQIMSLASCPGEGTLTGMAKFSYV